MGFFVIDTLFFFFVGFPIGDLLFRILMRLADFFFLFSVLLVGPLCNASSFFNLFYL